MAPFTINLEDMLGRTTVAEPREQDTVFGRGGFVNRNPGNRKFLSLLTKYEREYIQCKQRRYQKTLAVSILHLLLQQDVKFLKKDSKTGAWCTVKLSECTRKISQRLRERAPMLKEANKAKVQERNTAAAAAASSFSLPPQLPSSSVVTPVLPPLPKKESNGKRIFLNALVQPLNGGDFVVSDESISDLSDEDPDDQDEEWNNIQPIPYNYPSVVANRSDACHPMYTSSIGPVKPPPSSTFFSPIGCRENSQQDEPRKRHRSASSTDKEPDTCCPMCPCKRRRTSYALVQEDILPTPFQPGIEEDDLENLLDDSIGLDDYLGLFTG